MNLRLLPANGFSAWRSTQAVTDTLAVSVPSSGSTPGALDGLAAADLANREADGPPSHLMPREPFVLSTNAQVDARAFALLPPSKDTSLLPSRLLTSILQMVEKHAVESGVSHSAEAAMSELLSSARSHEICRYLSIASLPSSIKASLLLLIGRCLAGSMDLLTRRRLVGDAFASDNVEVRDAALQMVEMWQDRGLAPLVVQHVDSVTWLNDYARQIAQNLQNM